jgi:transmembrane sensor
MKKEDLLEKWLNDEITSAELEVLRTMPEFSSYLKIDAFTKRIELPVHDTEAGLQAVKKQLGAQKVKNSPKVITMSTLIKIAAVLVLLLVSYVYINSLPTTVKTEMAQTEILGLPDGSSVTLNEGSALSFNEGNWEKERVLTLSGEAFFDVSRGKTFTVSTAEGTVTVLGTQFNVLSNDNSFEVKCFEGLVSVTHNGTTVKLPQGTAVRLVNGKLIQEEVYTSGPGWIYKESSYKNIMLKNVLKELEKHYNIRVSTKNIDVNLRFTGSFTHENLEAALQSLTLPFGIDYTINNTNAVTLFANESAEE